MIPISDETKKVYKNDVVPGFITILIGDQLYPAETLYPAEDLYPKGGQFDENGWVEGSLSITEALCSAETLDYKRVEANKMEVKLASEEGNKNEFNGLAVQVSQTVNAEVIPLGSFTVSSTEREGDYYTKITAYDDMKKFIDTDVTDWWNTGVAFPITIKNLLLSLCKQVGVEQALPNSWTNSDVEITQNTYADSVKGSDILGMIQEACGLFFHTNRNNQLVVITGTADETEFKHTALYEDPTIAEYTIPGITGVQIKSTDNDIGTLYGEKTTVYQVTGNYLLLDKTDEERKAIAKGILANIGGKPYKPFSAKVKARNYIECGDPIKITTYNGNTSSFMLLSRTMTEQGLITDEIEVKGKANTVNNPRSNSRKIETLNKRAHEITETLNEYSSRFTNLETEQTEQGKKITETQSQIKQTADEINLSVSKSITETKAYADNAASAAESNAKSDTADKLKSYSTTTEMNSAITAKADEINLSVSKSITETKAYADNAASAAESNAKGDTADRLKSYSTTEEMNSAISQKADSITSTVSQTYQTKTDAAADKQTLESAISQKAGEISLSVSDGLLGKSASIKLTVDGAEQAQTIDLSGVRSAFADDGTNVTITSGKIKFKSNTIVIDSSNFELDSRGNVHISGDIYASSMYDSNGNGRKKLLDSTSDGLMIYSWNGSSNAAVIQTNKIPNGYNRATPCVVISDTNAVGIPIVQSGTYHAIELDWDVELGGTTSYRLKTDNDRGSLAYIYPGRYEQVHITRMSKQINGIDVYTFVADDEIRSFISAGWSKENTTFHFLK